MLNHKAIIGAGFAALLCTAAAPAFAQGPLDPVAEARKAHEGYDRYFAQASACRWTRPTLDTVMYRERELWRDLAALENKQAADAITGSSPEAQPCGGPIDQQARGEAFQTYWRWMTRSLIHAQYAAQPGWSQQLVVTNAELIAALEPIRKGLSDAMGAERAAAETQVLVNEARIVLNLICEPRKTERSATPRACPEVPAEFAAQRPMALKRAEAVELVNLLLPDAIRAEQRGEFGSPYQFRFDPFDFATNCRAGASTIWPAAPDTKELPGGVLEVTVRNYGDAAPVERDRVKKDGPGYVMVDDAGQPKMRSADSTLYASYDSCFL